MSGEVIQYYAGRHDQLGGIPAVIQDLHQFLQQHAGFRATVLQTDPSESLTGSLRQRVANRVNRQLSRDPELNPFRYLRRFKLSAADRTRLEQADIVHLHQNELVQDLVPTGRNKVLMQFHSADGLTGGCVFDNQCPELEAGCADCPVVQPLFSKLARMQKQHQRNMLETTGLTLAVNSLWTRSIAERSLSEIAPDNIPVIYPPTDTGIFVRDTHDEHRQGDDSPRRIGFIAYSIHDENKQFGDYLEIVQQLNQRFATEGVVIGSHGHKLPTCSAPIQYLGELTEPSKIAATLQSLDLLLITSASESFGKTSIEAQCCGVPVVAYQSGGIGETMLADKSGLLVEKNNIRNAIEAAEAVLGNASQYCNISDQSHADFLTKFSLDTVGNQLVSLYHDLLAE